MAQDQNIYVDSLVSYGPAIDPPTPDAQLARRSLSIFSRKGAETPEPKPSFIDQAAMPSPRRMTERQKSWIRRQSIGAPKKEKVNGTILKAVPAATTFSPISALEQAMATSPNEEVLTAISEHFPANAFDASHGNTPISATQTTYWNRSTTMLAQPQQSKSQMRKAAESRIGVWVNGVAQWEPEAHERRKGSMEWSYVDDLTGFESFRPSTAGAEADRSRPNLSVLIPGQQRRAVSESIIAQPRPTRPIISVAPAGIVSKFNISPPNIVLETALQDLVSPIDSAWTGNPAPPPRRPHAPLNLHPRDSPGSDERPRAPTRSSSSSSSVPGVEERDDTSVYSNPSSMTSVEAQEAETAIKILSGGGTNQLNIPRRSNSNKFSVGNPAEAGVFDDAASFQTHINGRGNVNKPLPPNPIPFPRRSAPAPPSSPTSTKSPVGSRRIPHSKSTKSAPGGGRAHSGRPALVSMKSTRSLTGLDALDQEFMMASPYASDMSAPVSPTLSEAEEDLAAHLSTIREDGSPQAARGLFAGQLVENTDEQVKDIVSVAEPEVTSPIVGRSGSVRSVMHPPERAPTLPKKSRKREWRASKAAKKHVAYLAMPNVKQPSRRKSAPNFHNSMYAPEAIVPPVPHLRKASSDAALPKVLELAQLLRSSYGSKRETLIAPLPTPRIVIDDGLCVVDGPTIIESVSEEDEDAGASASVIATSAEHVLLHIFSALTGLNDLFNTAMINKGMYRVFKENEMTLTRMVSMNESPACWEFREWCPPERNNVTDSSSKASSQLEHSPRTYRLCHRRDMTVLESLKKLILEHCQTFLRRETAFALASVSHPQSQRFNDAFWRIWCFCTIFGCDKGREEDITGQLDWLKGGILANQQGCVATVNTNLDFDMSSILLNAPDHFAKGNAGGLTAQQLYDMTELWTSLSVLLQGYHGRVEQARAHGVFENADVSEGDVEKEEAMLEEWTFYLLTLGPSAVLEMAEFATDSSSAGFAVAKEHGWTTWTPPTYSGSRSTFLKEPVSRIYEERVAAAALRLQNPREQEKKEMSRKRVATLAAEIRLRRQTSGYKRLPLIDMNSERPMSVMSRRDSTRSTNSVGSVSSMRSSNRPSGSRAPNSSASSQLLSPVSLWSPRKISPIIEDRVETFNRMSFNRDLLHSLGGCAEDTAQQAVRKITDMGFSECQAREALKVTDMGDGLRVDRAVDMLLRQS